MFSLPNAKPVSWVTDAALGVDRVVCGNVHRGESVFLLAEAFPPFLFFFVRIHVRLLSYTRNHRTLSTVIAWECLVRFHILVFTLHAPEQNCANIGFGWHSTC